MKKLVCLFLAMVLCLASVAALAESVPSKTVEDLTKVEFTAENMPAGFALAGFVLNDYAFETEEEKEAYAEKLEISEEEVAKLAAAESIEAYFGEEFDLKTMLESDTLNVYEFAPFVVTGYDPAYGKVTAKMLFATPYEIDEKVIVMVGLVEKNADGTNNVTWKAFEGVGVASDNIEAAGSVQVEFDPETMVAMQEGVALIAIVSK